MAFLSFVGKRKPTAAALQSALSQLESARIQAVNASAVKHPPVLAPGDFSDSVQDELCQVILDLKDVPSGQYVKLSDLNVPDSFLESFAIIQPAAKQYLLMSTPDSFGTHPWLELTKRLSAKQWSGSPRRASREIIKLVHSQNSAKTINTTDRTAVEQFAWDLVESAVARGTSDIHIQTRSDYAQVLFRINGELVEQPTMSFETATTLSSVLYDVHADSGSKGVSWSPEKVLDTSIEHQLLDGRKVQLRFSSGPIHPQTVHNFHAVIRVLLMDKSNKPIESIGYTPAMETAIAKMLIGAQGAVLLVGPTNSGKSTSMQAFIGQLYQNRGKNIKVITIEKPVEYLIPLACQMGVPEGRKSLEDANGNIFTTFLKGTLRQDPDVVMVGEIRAADECAATKDLILAGRKVLSTLHVYEVMAIWARLRELGVPESILYMPGFISGAIYQRLVPLLCGDCSVPLATAYESNLIREDLYERVVRVSALDQHDVRIRDHEGCATCGYTGIVGRTTCAEVLIPDDQFLQLLRNGDEEGARSYWHSNEELNVDDLGVTAVAHAISKMRLGLVCPKDVENQLGELKISHAQPRRDTYGGLASSNAFSRGGGGSGARAFPQ